MSKDDQNNAPGLTWAPTRRGGPRPRLLADRGRRTTHDLGANERGRLVGHGFRHRWGRCKAGVRCQLASHTCAVRCSWGAGKGGKCATGAPCWERSLSGFFPCGNVGEFSTAADGKGWALGQAGQALSPCASKEGDVEINAVIGRLMQRTMATVPHAVPIDLAAPKTAASTIAQCTRYRRAQQR